MKISVIILLFLIIPNIYAEIPLLEDTDIIVQEKETGFDLYIKKKNGINSILLTESQRDPGYERTTYSLRTADSSSEHAKEIRFLDGEELSRIEDTYFLLDSSPEDYPVLKKAFHFDLPREVFYGFPWTRNGLIRIKTGVIINARLFKKKYADYSGEFADQWITLVPGNKESTGGESPGRKTLEPGIVEVSSYNGIGKDTDALSVSIPPDEPSLPETESVPVNREEPVNKADPLYPDFTEDVILKDSSGKEIKKTIYRGNNDGSRTIERSFVYEYDKDLLVRITEYNNSDKMLSFYQFEYDDSGNRTNVGHFNPEGNVILRE